MGSFLGLLADRLPRGEGVVRRRSFCRACGSTLRPTEIVPILSYALAGGRCRGCGAAIPPMLLYSEVLATGLAAVALAAAPGAGAWPVAAVLWTLQALALCDLRWLRLPDSLNATLLALALAASLWLPGSPAPAQAMLGAVLGAGAFWTLRVGYQRLRGREGLGLGDVKMMAGVGALVGPSDLPLTVLIAALAGVAVAVFGSVRGARLRATRPIPFGAALGAAAALIWCQSLTA